MMNPVALPVSAVESTNPQNLKKNDIAGAAGQFESLLLTQILKSARETGTSGGWMGGGEDSGSTTAMEMAEEQFAAALSARGGLGLAAMVTSSFQHAPASVPASHAKAGSVE